MATARKLPSGNYRVQVFVCKDSEGKRQYKSFTAPTKKEAEFEATNFLLHQKGQKNKSKVSFDVAAGDYLGSKSNVLSPSTIRGYSIMRRNAFSDIKNMSLEKLSSGDALQKQMNKNAKTYAAKSLKNQYGFVSAVLTYHDVSVPKCTLKPPENNQMKVPTRKEAEKILKLISGDFIECQVLLAATCSLRQSEIYALRPGNIDDNQIKISGARVPDENNNYVYKKTNKSDAGTRTVTMSAYLTKRLKELCKGKGREDYIFDLRPDQVLYRFKKVLRDNGMHEFTIHSLRHYFAAILHVNNVPDKYVMEMGGWSSDNVLKKVYQYTFEDEASKAKRKVNSYFDKIMQHEMQHEKEKTP